MNPSLVPSRLRAHAGRLSLVVALSLCAVAMNPVGRSTATAVGPAGLSVSGNQLLKDGEPYIPRGFNMLALVTPSWCTRSQTAPASANFDQAEMDRAKSWKVTALRFQISQEGLTGLTVSQAAKDAYLERVRSGVALARSNGFDVIVSMQDQYFSCGAVHPLPSSQTVEAWNLLAPVFQSDPNVMLELFNEPDVNNDVAGWQQWQHGGTTPVANLGTPAVGQQDLIDQIRALGNTNVVIADAADKAANTSGMPLLTDPTGNLIYGIHPYFFSQGLSWWEQEYGAYSTSVPLIATEWNYKADKCGTVSESLAPALLEYLQAHQIGVFGHAFDMPETIVADMVGTPTRCGSAVGGSGQVLQDFFAAKAPDTTTPTTPANVQAVATSPTQVSLSWGASTDDRGVRGYFIRRNGQELPRVDVTAFADAGLLSNTTYVYAVQAVDAAGNRGEWSPSVTVTTPRPPDTTNPSAPTGLSARIVSPSNVALKWQASTDNVGVVGYSIARNGTSLGMTTSATFSDSTVVAGATYSYEVRALDAAGNRSSGETAGATIPAAAATGLTGTYFDTATLTTQKLVRNDKTIDFNWGSGSPASTIGRDTFSVRWTGKILPIASESYTFYTQSDNGARLWVNGQRIINNWTSPTTAEVRGTIALQSNQAYTIKLEYVEQTSSASVALRWSSPSVAKQVIPAAQLLAK